MALVTGCAKAHEYGFVNPGTTPTPSAAPSSCATPDVADADIVYVAASSDMTPATDGADASIFGYAPYPGLADSDAPPQTSAVVAVTTSQRVQVVNTEPDGSTIAHSAVGFTTASFPATPYTFPSGSDQAIGTAITRALTAGSGTPWSTGEIAPLTDSVSGAECASQIFTATTPGTYYFGDYATYNSVASMRGEIVVSQ